MARRTPLPSYKLLSLEVLDTLHFSDGRPFNQADEGLTESVSVFPPMPSVLSGAVRAWLGRVNGGWDKSVLGDGPFKPGRCCFGPLILIATIEDKTRYYLRRPDLLALRKRAYATARDDIAAMTLQTPSVPFSSDIGTLEKCFVPPTDDTTDNRWEAAPQGWLEIDAFRRILAGNDVRPIQDSEFLEDHKILSTETRVGLEIDQSGRKRQAKAGRLFSLAMRRPGRGASFILDEPFRLGVPVAAVSGVAKMLSDGMAGAKHEVLPLGGRGRGAVASALDTLPPTALPPANLPKRCRALVIALSPVILGKVMPFEKQEGVRIIAAIHDRPIRFNTWSMKDRRRSPLVWILPAGACWVLEIDDAAHGHLASRMAKQGLNEVPPVLEAGEPEELYRIGFGAWCAGAVCWGDEG